MKEIRTNALGLRRVAVAVAFAIATGAFLAIKFNGDLRGSATLFTRSTWISATLVAALLCFLTSRRLGGRDRLAWRYMALGCGLWLFGQISWAYLQLAYDATPAYPHWTQMFLFGYSACFVKGLLMLPKPQGAATLTVRHIGNLILIACTVAASLVIALWEPAVLPSRNWAANAIAILTAISLAAVCLTALYLLWSYRWRSDYWPLLILAAGGGIHTLTYVTTVHLRMIGAYSADRLSNVGWLVGYGAIACAAYERMWQIDHPTERGPSSLFARERRLEAAVPAFLIVVMLLTVWINTPWLTTPVATTATLIAVIFAVVLSLRDAWIQREEQRLVAALNESHLSLLAANRELVGSESRYRALNSELEERVAKRTVELQAAYRELEGFSYAVAHDIKAPLRVVNSFAALLMEEHGGHLDDKARGYVDRMRRNALHMSQLVDDLLAYAQVERLEPQIRPIDLRASVDECLQEQRDEIARLKAEINVNVEPTVLQTDSRAIAQALRNLLQNALKFSRNATPPQIRFDAARAAGKVRMSISDNGIGFDMQYHDRIFALFERLHRLDEYAGTGIGLAIARKAVERVGGRIWAHSEPNRGATFYVELPDRQQ